jgi:hypothetical protein
MTATTFSGSGASLTNLDPANIGSGTAGIDISGDADTVDGYHATAFPRLAAANIFTTGTQEIRTGGNSTIGLIVKGHTSQGANLMEFQDSSGAVLASIDEFGNFNKTGDIYAIDDNSQTLGTPVTRWARGYFGPGSVHIVASAKDTQGVYREWVLGAQVSPDGSTPVDGNFKMRLQTTPPNDPPDPEVYEDFVDLTPLGDLGIGTTTPGAKLDVNGSAIVRQDLTVNGSLIVDKIIKFGPEGRYAVGGVENLRTLRGWVDKDGNILAGSGFTVEHVKDSGEYVVKYDTDMPPFEDIPVPTVSAFPGDLGDKLYAQAHLFDIKRDAFVVHTAVNENVTDHGFTFVVTGLVK